MNRQEWFGRKTWTDQDRREFHARLARSRTSFHKSQYLRIQALVLEEADPPEISGALELLDELLRDYPDASQVALAYHQKGRCLIKIGRFEDALDALRSALDAEQRFRGMRTAAAYLDYADLVLCMRREDLYETAVAILNQNANAQDEPFPYLQYRSGTLKAFLCDRLGRIDDAKWAATRALAAAAKKESPFRYHRDLGLVTNVIPDIQQELWRLAGQPA